MTSRRIYPSLFFTQIIRDTPICNPGINKVHDNNPSFGFNCCCWGERSPPARTHTQIRFLWSESRADVQNVTDCFPRERSHKGAVIPTAHAHCALPTPWPAPDCYRRRNRGFGADPLVISALFFISAISERFGLLLRGFDPKVKIAFFFSLFFAVTVREHNFCSASRHPVNKITFLPESIRGKRNLDNTRLSL